MEPLNKRPVRSVNSACLDIIKEKLVALHPGQFQPDDYLARWCREDIARLLLDHGRLFQPEPHQRVSLARAYGPFDCHKNALHKATLEPDLTAWFGFSLYWEDPLGDFLWWVHSFCLSTDGGTILDPAEKPSTGPVGLEGPAHQPRASSELPAIFFAIPWGLELYQCLAPDFPADKLPPVLARSMYPILQRFGRSDGRSSDLDLLARLR